MIQSTSQDTFQSSEPPRPARHLVITVHGIRTFGHWQERLESQLKSHDPDIVVFNYKFGYFSVIAFLIPFLRWLVTYRFRRDMLREIKKEPWDRIDIVSHSFGTHLVGWALHGIKPETRPQIHTIILAGSVLKAGFPWRDLVGVSVARVVNECGIYDKVLLLNQLAVLFTGMAGREGFSGMTGKDFRNRYFKFGHSGYFLLNGKPDGTFMQDKWLPLLLTETDIKLFPDPRPTTALRGLATFLFNNAEPIKLLLYVMPLVLLVLWVLEQRDIAVAQRIEAENQRQFAEQQQQIAEEQRKLALTRQLAAQAQLFVGQSEPASLTRGMLLAVESMRRIPSLEGNRALDRAFSLSPRLVARLEHGDTVRSQQFNADGNLLATGDHDGVLRLWDLRNASEMAKLKTDGPIRVVRFSPDGQYVASAGDSHSLRVLRVDSGTEIAAMRLGKHSWYLDFSPDGKQLATILSGNTVTILAVPSGEQIIHMVHDDDVRALQFSRDGKLLATGSNDRLARIWEATTGKELARMQHESPVHQVVFSPNGKWLITADSNDAYVWNVASGKRIQALSHEAFVSEISFSPDGRRLATGYPNGISRIWNTETWQTLTRTQHSGAVRQISFSPDGKLFATAMDYLSLRKRYGETQVFETENGKELARTEYENGVDSLSFSPDGRTLAAAAGNEIWILDTLPRNVMKQLEHSENVRTAAFAADGTKLAIGGVNGAVRLWNLSGTINAIDLTSVTSTVMTLHFSPTGEWLAAGDADGAVLLWDLSNPTQAPIVRKHHHRRVTSLAFSPDSTLLVSAGEDRTLYIREVKSGQLVDMELQADRYYGVAYSPDGRWLASVSGGQSLTEAHGEVILRSTIDRREVHNWKHWEVIYALAFSPDSTLLATGSGDFYAHIWDVENKKEIAEFRHDSVVTGVVFSPDGKWLFTHSGGLVHVWDIATGTLISQFGHKTRSSDIIISPDGKWLVSAGTDRFVRYWLWHPQDLIDEACMRITRNLLKSEWGDYLSSETYRTTCANLPEPER